MKTLENVKIFLVIVAIILVMFGTFFLLQKITPDNGIVLDKTFNIHDKKSDYKVLVKNDNYIIPMWITVTQNYYDSLSVGDTYNKNENSYMYSYWFK